MGLLTENSHSRGFFPKGLLLSVFFCTLVSGPVFSHRSFVPLSHTLLLPRAPAQLLSPLLLAGQRQLVDCAADPCLQVPQLPQFFCRTCCSHCEQQRAKLDSREQTEEDVVIRLSPSFSVGGILPSSQVHHNIAIEKRTNNLEALFVCKLYVNV